MKTRIERVLFGAGIALSLSFGATQAVASSGQASQGQYCFTAQERAECYLACQEENKLGICDPEIGCYCI